MCTAQVDIERIFHDETSVRRFVGRFAEPRDLRACYEAGPTGYELHRLLSSIGVRCQDIAPSLIPKAPGERIKTDRRDARRLARLHRAGELTAIRVPSPQEEAVRDLCRARDDAVADRTRARHRLSKFLLRHAAVWRGGNQWTLAHDRWLRSIRLGEPALQATFRHHLAVLEVRDAGTALHLPGGKNLQAGPANDESVHSSARVLQVVGMTRIEWASESDLVAVCAVDRTLEGTEVPHSVVRRAVEAGECLVAREAGAVVGFAVFNRRFYGYGFIELLVVHPAHRRRGVATALVRHVESICPTDKLFTSTNESNAPMHRLCESLGWVRSGYIENLDEGDPEVVYFKRLRG